MEKIEKMIKEIKGIFGKQVEKKKREMERKGKRRERERERESQRERRRKGKERTIELIVEIGWDLSPPAILVALLGCGRESGGP